MEINFNKCASNPLTNWDTFVTKVVVVRCTNLFFYCLWRFHWFISHKVQFWFLITDLQLWFYNLPLQLWLLSLNLQVRILGLPLQLWFFNLILQVRFLGLRLQHWFLILRQEDSQGQMVFWTAWLYLNTQDVLMSVNAGWPRCLQMT